jgi:hypothetical protein
MNGGMGARTRIREPRFIRVNINITQMQFYLPRSECAGPKVLFELGTSQLGRIRISHIRIEGEDSDELVRCV